MVFQALQKVFRKPSYMLLALGTSLVIFAFAVWLPNLRLLWSFFQSGATIVEKLHLTLSLLGSISTNFSLLSASHTITIAILFGVYVALLVYFLRKRVVAVSRREAMVGTGGVLSSLFGIGCATCGSFLLTTLFGWAGASAVLALLPLRGSEFGIMGVILLAIALYATAKQIENPLVCKVR